MSDRDHWEGRYRDGPADRVGWYRPRLDASLELIRQLAPSPSTRLIDVGGGASTLVDHLLDEGLESVTVLDLSAAALAISRTRLGPRAARVDWRVDDMLAADLPPGGFEIWHDRAVFHFLVDEAHRERYRRQLRATLAPGGHLVIGAFGPEAPPRCSDLPVQRYDIDALSAAVGPGFARVAERREAHRTPGGTDQPYVYGLFERTR